MTQLYLEFVCVRQFTAYSFQRGGFARHLGASKISLFKALKWLRALKDLCGHFEGLLQHRYIHVVTPVH